MDLFNRFFSKLNFEMKTKKSHTILHIIYLDSSPSRPQVTQSLTIHEESQDVNSSPHGINSNKLFLQFERRGLIIEETVKWLLHAVYRN